MSELFEQWLAHREGQADVPDLPPVQPLVPAPAPAPESVQLAPEPIPTPSVAPLPRTIFFKPRRRTRWFLTTFFVACLAALALACWYAWTRRTQLGYELALLALGVTAIAYAVRGGSAVSTLTVTGGTLEIRRGGSRTTFDLTSSYTEVEVVGRPGGRRWKVLFHRGATRPYVVDGSMVDPAEFMKVLRYYRRDLAR